MTKMKAKSTKQIITAIITILVFIVGGFFGFDYLLPDNDNPYQGEYYLGAEGLSGEDLQLFLTQLVSTDVIGVTYANAKIALAESDVDPNDPTKVLTIYTRVSVNREWDSVSWHREHVWPNSRLGLPRVTENQVSQASDLHNLRAIVPATNSSRGNKIFDTVTGSLTYFPGDDDKGDVARILFYMVIRYPELSLVDEILGNDPDTNYTSEAAKMAKLSVILAWHYDDPVDDFERNRNEVIFKWQNNRNPFIDNPEYVDMIFGINN